jgi:hypothetical protein
MKYIAFLFLLAVAPVAIGFENDNAIRGSTADQDTDSDLYIDDESDVGFGFSDFGRKLRGEVRRLYGIFYGGKGGGGMMGGMGMMGGESGGGMMGGKGYSKGYYYYGKGGGGGGKGYSKGKGDYGKGGGGMMGGKGYSKGYGDYGKGGGGGGKGYSKGGMGMGGDGGYVKHYYGDRA